jgi:hypothetical protein
MTTLNGITVTRAEVFLSAWGVPWADVELDEPAELSGDVVLEFTGLTLVGTIASGGPYQGRARYRVAGGKGRWGSTVKRKAYANDAGVKASLVVRDAAGECGETLTGPLPTHAVGPHFTRPDGAASDVLNLVTPRAWYVSEDGLTRIGARPQTDYSGPAEVMRIDDAKRVVELSTDDLTGLRPGASVNGLRAVDVVIRQTPKRLRVYLYGGQRNRLTSALERLVLSLFPDIAYRGAYEFRVVNQEGDRLNLQPTRVSLGLPDLPRVPMRPGLAGARNNVQLGSLVVVQFLNADPARPIVTGFDAPDSAGWRPMSTELQVDPLAGSVTIADGTLGVARQTDSVVAGPFGGTITTASMKARCG